jgi:hypothetical protein
MTRAVNTPENLVSFYQTILRIIPENSQRRMFTNDVTPHLPHDRMVGEGCEQWRHRIQEWRKQSDVKGQQKVTEQTETGAADTGI